jgi:DNA-binding NarL/FixJ family response regulator
MIKLLLVDDHKLIRDGIRSLLDVEKEFEIVSEAEHGKQALELLDKHDIDIVVIDINMPVMGGIEATEKISKQFPNVSVLALTMLNEEQHIRQMLKAGAAGYILKNAGQDELVDAIKSISTGQHYFSKEATQVIMMDMMKVKKAPSTGGTEERKLAKGSVYLTEREKDILRLIAKEHTNQEIADDLFISVRTVDAHRRNLLQKIGARNTAGLVIYALENSIM